MITVAQILTDRPFDVHESPDFQDTFVAVDFSEQPAKLIVSTNLKKYMLTEANTGGNMDFVYNLEVSCCLKDGKVFVPEVVTTPN